MSYNNYYGGPPPPQQYYQQPQQPMSGPYGSPYNAYGNQPMVMSGPPMPSYPPAMHHTHQHHHQPQPPIHQPGHLQPLRGGMLPPIRYDPNPQPIPQPQMMQPPPQPQGPDMSNPNVFRDYFHGGLVALTFNSKPIITDLTILAGDYSLRMAPIVSEELQTHILNVRFI